MFLRLITHESDTLLPETVGLGDISDVEDSSNKWYEGEETLRSSQNPRTRAFIGKARRHISYCTLDTRLCEEAARRFGWKAALHHAC